MQLNGSFRPRLIRANRSGDTKSHFIEAYRFDKKQRKHLLQVMQQDTLGDEPSQRLFVSAVEYELAALQPALDEAKAAASPVVKRSAGPTNAEVTKIQEAARTLAGLLADSHKATRSELIKSLAESDDFQRSYDQRYLLQLQVELDRLAASSESIEDQQTEQAITATVDEKTRKRFINMLAHAYEECFEVRPTAQSSGPFSHVLAAVSETIGLDAVNDEAFVSEALSND